MLPSATHGLELKARWCGLLLSGHKTVELRSYALPNDCIGVPVYLLRTPDGNEGMSTLPADGVDAGAQGVDVAGVAVFDGQTRYTSYEKWAADVQRHTVPPGSPYGWQPGVTSELWGWHVGRVHAVEPAVPVPTPMRRVLGSLFQAAAKADWQQTG